MSSINNKPSFPPASLPPATTPAPTPERKQDPKADPGENPMLEAQLQAQIERSRAGAPGTQQTRQREKVTEQTYAPTQKARSGDEIERLASQVGYVRQQKKKRHGFELDDMSQAPIPLPADDIDDKNGFDQKSLDDAQEGLTLQSNELKELTRDVEAGNLPQLGVIAKLVERAFKPTPQDIERLSAMQQKAEAQPEVSLGAVNSSMQGLFGINLSKVAQGPAMVAAALVVAGMSDAVQPGGDSLEPGPLCRGMQSLVSNSNEAVDDARTMSSGINRQLAMQRTFVFRK